ncbi:hypothetical protein [Actinocrispum wychmicini]|uniref:Uncharacterized protein n=1 Tax=Actinocrispum wychmicini TaxID=1213861 RepID=A0A4R2K673_9PSEU|nr:hypothetical protein [Actinocrispum wychmicini]TCO65308.1 hypothetical protein EV192_1011100 [Actinocrispum wychmicini]
MADNEHPQHRDLTPSQAPPPAGPVDPEQHAQFQQFQQFQQFLKFQESQGGAAPLQLPPAKKPLWKKILQSWPVRKLAFYLVVIAVIAWLITRYFGGSSQDDGKGTHGLAGPGDLKDPGRPPGSPSAALNTLYLYAATGTRADYATNACKLLFSPEGKQAFVADFGGGDCESVIRGLDGKVGPLRQIPLIDTIGKSEIEISSCRQLQLREGTTGLGRFTLKKVSDGWVITGHQSEPDPCPATTSTPSTTSVPPTS